jgi:hypothetical protein
MSKEQMWVCGTCWATSPAEHAGPCSTCGTTDVVPGSSAPEEQRDVAQVPKLGLVRKVLRRWSAPVTLRH